MQPTIYIWTLFPSRCWSNSTPLCGGIGAEFEHLTVFLAVSQLQIDVTAENTRLTFRFFFSFFFSFSFVCESVMIVSWAQHNSQQTILRFFLFFVLCFIFSNVFLTVERRSFFRHRPCNRNSSRVFNETRNLQNTHWNSETKRKWLFQHTFETIV